MIAVVQRVSRATVHASGCDGVLLGAIDSGFVVLLGISRGDSPHDVDWMVNRLARLRVFADDAGKMNLDIRQVNGSILLVSQFTLLADLSRGHRPGFSAAEEPSIAVTRCEEVARALVARGIQVAQGSFGADMRVTLENDGPVTIILDSRAKPDGSKANPRSSKG